MTKDKVEKAALLFLIVAGIVYLYGTLIFWPKWTAVRQENVQLQGRARYYHILKSYAAEPGYLDKKIADLESRVHSSDPGAPKHLDKAQIMVSLYDLAKQFKVSPMNISFTPARSKGTVATVGVTFACSGTPADMLALLQTVEEAKNLPLALNGVDLTVQKGLMQTQLKLTGYALAGGEGSGVLPPFMNYPFGVGNMAEMFR